MENIFKEIGNGIDYNILPVHKHVRFVLIKDRSEFDSILSKLLNLQIDLNAIVVFVFQWNTSCLNKSFQRNIKSSC